GAIVVLFLFVIMLLGPSAQAPGDHRGRIPRTIGAGLFGAGGLAAMALLITTAPKPPPGTAQMLPSVTNDFGSVDAFGRILFTQGLPPFELSSALLMVAIVGAVAVARGRGKQVEHLSPQESLERSKDVADPKAPHQPGVLEGASRS